MSFFLGWTQNLFGKCSEIENNSAICFHIIQQELPNGNICSKWSTSNLVIPLIVHFLIIRLYCDLHIAILVNSILSRVMYM